MDYHGTQFPAASLPSVAHKLVIVLWNLCGLLVCGYHLHTYSNCCFFLIASELFQYEGAVRLVNGPYTSEGILELSLNDIWGTVCSTSPFPTIAANIVCSQLGYDESISSRSVRYR